MLLRIIIVITAIAAIFLRSADVQCELNQSEFPGLPDSVYEENGNDIRHDYDKNLFFVPRNDTERSDVLGIFDGWNVSSPELFPYHAYIACVRYPIDDVAITSWKCNGAIINDRFVITSATCVQSCTVIKIRVGATVHPSMNSSDVPQEYLNRIKNTLMGSKPYYVHPWYIPGYDGNDLALIETFDPIIFSKSVGQVILPDKPELALNVPIVATGFGKLHKYNIDWELQFLTLNVANRTECGKHFPNLGVTTMCAKGKEFDRVERGTLCEEFGAPAVLKRDNRTLVGIYLRSIATCGLGGPEAFTAIENYTSWIREIAIDRLIT